MSIKASVEINADLKKIILEQTLLKINNAIDKAVPAMKARLPEMVASSIRSSPTVSSLLNGGLRGEMGLSSAESSLNDVLETIKNSVDVSFTKFRSPKADFAGGLKISIIKKNFSQILASNGASYDSNGHPIPWLSWLLVEGDKIIISDHFIVFDLNSRMKEASRTGDALMLPSGQSGKYWRVPPEHSGTIQDNFITRALKDSDFQTRAGQLVFDLIKVYL